MNLVIDIGNTRIRTATFKDSEMVNSIVDEEKGKKTVDYLKRNITKIHNCIIASVAEMPKNIKNILRRSGIKIIELSKDTPVPFTNKYKTQDTLGKDRIACIAAACLLYPSNNVLVIDYEIILPLSYLCNVLF